jgi:Tfp pilus assembly protein PilN
MRPVNLIPSDERRGDRTPMRTGAFSYVLIGGLALALLAMIGLAFTGKQVSDRKNEVAKLQQEEQQATARAQSLQAFADFRTVQQTRADTVASLAQSRFDWQRVLNELARVVPSDIWLVQMSGTVDPSVSVQNAPQIAIRASVPGPALEIVGCAPSQDAVAGFVSNLEEIDGVTRVGVDSSQKRDATGGSSGSSGSTSTSSGSDQGLDTDCRTRNFIARFEIVVAFDSVPTPATATASPSVPSGLAATGSQLASQSTSTASTGG